jgi:hypothetical protein
MKREPVEQRGRRALVIYAFVESNDANPCRQPTRDSIALDRRFAGIDNQRPDAPPSWSPCAPPLLQ